MSQPGLFGFVSQCLRLQSCCESCREVSSLPIDDITHTVLRSDPSLGHHRRRLHHDTAPAAHGHAAEVDEVVVCECAIVGRVCGRPG